VYVCTARPFCRKLSSGPSTLEHMGRHVPREAFDHGGSENAHAPTPTLPRRASSRVLPCQEHVKQPSIRDGKTVCRPVDGRSARPRAPPNPLSRCLMNANDAVVGARGPAARSAQSHPPLSLSPSLTVPAVSGPPRGVALRWWHLPHACRLSSTRASRRRTWQGHSILHHTPTGISLYLHGCEKTTLT
jgi:hypothetical protein